MTHIRLLLLFSVWIFTSNAYSQNTECQLVVSGIVVDDHDRQPLAYAHVYIKSLNIGSVADSTGYYELRGLCAGTYQIDVSYIGTILPSTEIELSSSTTLNLYPEIHPEVLESIEISTTESAEFLLERLDKIQVNSIAFEGTTLADKLQNTVGLNVLRTGSSIGKPMIHGMVGNRVIIMNNGVRLESQQWGSEHAPEVDINTVEDIEVIKDAGTIQYGSDAIGGVVLLVPREISGKLKGEVKLSGQTNGRIGASSISLEGGFGDAHRINWRVQGSGTRGGNTKTAQYFLNNTGVKELNYSLTGQYAHKSFDAEVFYSQINTKIGIFSGAHIGNLTDLNNAFQATRPATPDTFQYAIGRPYQNVNHELAKTVLSLKRGHSTIGIQLSRQYNLRQEYDKDKPLNDSLAALNLPALHLEITTLASELFWRSHSTNKRYTTKNGLLTTNQQNTFEGRYFIPNYIRKNVGGYTIHNWTSSNYKTAIEGGLRYDHVEQTIYRRVGDEIISPQYAYSGLSGTLSAAIRASETTTINIRGGHAWRPPTINELYSDGLHHGAAAIERGDTTLTEEKLNHTSIGFVWRNRRSHLIVDAYLNSFSNFIYLQPTGIPELTIRGAFPSFDYRQTAARIIGIDISFNQRFARGIEYNLTASIMRGQRDNGTSLPMMPANRMLHSIKRQHQNGLMYGISAQIVAEQRLYDADTDYLPPPEGYVLFNFVAGKTFKTKHQPFTLGFGVNNFLNTAYRDYLNRLRYFADDQGINFTINFRIPITL